MGGRARGRRRTPAGSGAESASSTDPGDFGLRERERAMRAQALGPATWPRMASRAPRRSNARALLRPVPVQSQWQSHEETTGAAGASGRKRTVKIPAMKEPTTGRDPPRLDSMHAGDYRSAEGGRPPSNLSSKCTGGARLAKDEGHLWPSLYTCFARHSAALCMRTAFCAPPTSSTRKGCPNEDVQTCRRESHGRQSGSSWLHTPTPPMQSRRTGREAGTHTGRA